MSRSRNRTRGWKRALLYGLLTVVAAIPGLILLLFLDKAPTETSTWRYSEMIEQVEKKQVKAIRLDRAHSKAIVTTQAGTNVLVNLPNDPDLVKILTQKQVAVSTVPSIEVSQPLNPLVLIALGVVLAGSFLWVWALVDCVTYETSEGGTRIVWVLIIIFASWLGALLYLLIRRPQRS